MGHVGYSAPRLTHPRIMETASRKPSSLSEAVVLPRCYYGLASFSTRSFTDSTKSRQASTTLRRMLCMAMDERFLQANLQRKPSIVGHSTTLQHQALWLSGYSDRLEIYFLRERRFESCRRRLFCHLSGCTPSFCIAEGVGRLGRKLGAEWWLDGGFSTIFCTLKPGTRYLPRYLWLKNAWQH